MKTTLRVPQSFILSEIGIGEYFVFVDDFQNKPHTCPVYVCKDSSTVERLADGTRLTITTFQSHSIRRVRITEAIFEFEDL